MFGSHLRCINRPVLSNNYATLREIEGRLKSIRNIEKITNTMKIVASTKLNAAQRAMSESRVYGQSSNEVFSKAETKPAETGKTLIVVCSSDKGLCGGVHSNLTRATRRRLEEKPDADICVLGEKAKAQMARMQGKSMVLSFSGLGKDVPSFSGAQAIADRIMQLPTKYDNIEVIYNTFQSAVSYEPRSINAFSEEAILASGMFTLLK